MRSGRRPVGPEPGGGAQQHRSGGRWGAGGGLKNHRRNHERGNRLAREWTCMVMAETGWPRRPSRRRIIHPLPDGRPLEILEAAYCTGDHHRARRTSGTGSLKSRGRLPSMIDCRKR